LACLAATALTLPLRGVVDADNIVMIFLLVVAKSVKSGAAGDAVARSWGRVISPSRQRRLLPLSSCLR